MMSYCAYGDCSNKYLPCTSTAFFTLPKDYRRPIWIENSGNPALKDIKPTANRQFCEEHFDLKYIRRQFSRTTLRKDAVPYKYDRGRRFMYRALSREEEAVESTPRSTTVDQTVTEEESLITSSLMEDHDEDVITYIQTEDSTMGVNSSPSSIEQLLQDETDEYDLIEEYSLQDVQEPEEVEKEVDVEEDQESPCESPSPPQEEQPACTRIRREARQTQTPTVSIIETRPANDDCDEDKHFALSLLGHFKRLPPKTKAIAKLKILQYLTELEFDSVSDVL